jgi:hypothetical protein
MQGRILCGIALGVASTLGGWGCSAPPKRSEAPIQFRQWKNPAGLTSAAEKAKAKGDETFPVTPPSVAEATTARPSIWTYRPGSLLFRRKPSAPPAIPVGESDGVLSNFFPGLSGKRQGDGLRLTRKERRPTATPALARRSAAPSGERLASNSPGLIPVLPVGLKIETSPKPPSPSLPEGFALAKAEEEPKASPAEEPITLIPTPDERLTSHEAPMTQPSPAPTASPSPASSVDPLSLDLPAPQGSPADSAKGPAPKTEAGEAEPAPVDEASRPASAVVEAPEKMAFAEPTPVEANPAVEAKPTVEEKPAVEADLPVKPLLPPNPSVDPVRPSPGTGTEPATSPDPAPAPSPSPSPSLETDPVLKRRPRMSRVEPMLLPPAEFPATYHAQSISRVLKEETPIDLDARAPTTTTATAAHRRPLFPRLTRLMSPKGVEDRAVTQASHPVPAKREATKRSTLSEPGEVPEWWKSL